MNETPLAEPIPPKIRKRDIPFESFGREIKLVTLDWTVGFIDGEGSFGIYRIKDKAGRKNPHYYARITCTNTDRLTLECLKLTYGGSISTTGAGKTHWKTAWRWALNGYEAMDLNERLYKRFVTKADHSRLFRNFCRYRYGDQALSLETCHRYKIKLQALNRRGQI